MPEELTFRFIDGGGGTAQPSGGSPTAAQFGRREAPGAPAAPSRTAGEQIEDRQAREPARADTPPIPRVDEPIEPTAPPVPPVPAVTPTVTPEAQPPEVPVRPPAPLIPPRPVQPVPTTAAPPQPAVAGLLTTGPQAAIAAAASVAVAGVVAARAIVGEANKVVENIAPFSPEVARTRAVLEARRVQQAVRLAEEVGPAAERFEAIKGLAGEFATELRSKIFEFAEPALEAGAAALLLNELKDVPGGIQLGVSILREIDRRLKEITDGSPNSLFNRDHLEPPGFNGDVIRSGDNPENAPRGLELR